MRTKLFIASSLSTFLLLAGCSSDDKESTKTEEEIRAEVKAELEAEAEREKLKEEIKQELANENSTTNTNTQSDVQPSVSQENEFVSPEPYVTSNVTFSNFDLRKQSDGYSLHMDTKNTNEKYSVAFGWGKSGTITLVTSDGEYTDEFPHMEQLDAGETKNYAFKFKNSTGELKELIIKNVNLVNNHNGKLPTPGKDESFTIPLK